MSAIIDFPDDSFNELDLSEADYKKLLDQAPVNDLQSLRTGTQHAGFDSNAGESWIYPKNLPMRAYQYSITQAALYRNTLVVLPTGLGKTFIAAVVMYNLYRWYPTGKVIFMAPTRPLVAQQIEACQRIMPFPLSDTVELTGKLPKSKRVDLWRTKRVFFATPQVVQSDIVGDRDGGAVDFPFQQVKLLVIDEAHKAKGRYAYSEVTQTIFGHNRYFRVVALSATPGRTMEDVAEVCRNLFISHVEVRWDTSIDVVSYVHQRSMKTITVPLGDEITALRQRLLDIIDPYLRQLIDADVLSGALRNVNRNFLLFEQKRFRERNQRERHPQYSAISTNFSMCISLYHALELLERHGLRVFVNSFDEDEDGKAKFVLMERRLRDLVDEVRQQLGPNPFDVSAQTMTNGCIAPMPADLDFGHPKYEEARKCVLAHFESNASSRAIIFCEYRESVLLIYRLLLQHVPLLKPRCFVGQGAGSTAGAMRALTQKQQLKIMQDFRSGASNILVATSIGEEGIDVGEVELIVCFDISSSNPTRFIQRIGRTGRKKNGNVVMLVTEGREAQLLKEVLVHKDQTNKKILQSRIVKEALYQHSPRLVPTEFNPKCVETYIEPDKLAAETTEGKRAKKTKTKKAQKIDSEAIKGTQDLRTFFKKAPQPALDAAECEIFEAPSSSSSSASRPQLSTQVRVRLRKSLGVDSIENFLKPLATQATSEQSNAEQPTPMPQSPTPPPPPPKKADPQRLRKLNKLLQSHKPLISDARRNVDLHTQLRSETLPRSHKLRLLRQHHAWVHEICAQMDVLQALDISQDEMASEEQKIRKDYELILAQFEDADELAEFLAKQSGGEGEDEVKFFDLFALAKCEADDAFKAAQARVFDGLPTPDFCVDNFDFIVNQMKMIEKSKAELDLLERSLNTLPCEASMVYTNTTIATTTTSRASVEAEAYEEQELSIAQALADSKYQSQWSAHNSARKSDKSTTLERSGTLTQAFRRQVEERNTKNSTDDCIDITKSSASGEASEEELDALIEAAAAIERQQDERHANATPLLQVLKHCSTPLAKSAVQLKNCSTPLANKTKADDKNAIVEQKTPERSSNTSVKSHADLELLSELDKDMDIFMTSFELAQLHEAPKTPTTTTTTAQPKNEANSMLAELEFNMDDFLEPLPEEVLLTQSKTSNSMSSELKENENRQPELLQLPSAAQKPAARHSPNLFDETISPVRPLPVTKSLSLAAKLATKCSALRPIASDLCAANANILKSPQNRMKTDSKKYEKSPSVFDMYLNKMRGNAKAKTTTTITKLIRQEQTSINAADESVIGLPRRKSAKRKIIDSDSDGEKEEEKQSPTTDAKRQKTRANESDSDFECIPETQMQSARFSMQRKKRRNFNSFIECEAAQSGSDNDDEDDEAEHTIGAYIKDSVIVSSGDEDSDIDEAARSHVQAMYLQATRSPHMRRGAFKIPAPRVFNDTDDIFSQAVEADSHYIPDSFVVEEENEEDARIGKDDDYVASKKRKRTHRQAQDVSLCPLERAERILKEQRRQRRLQKRAGSGDCLEAALPAPTNAKRRRVRCITIESSSDEE